MGQKMHPSEGDWSGEPRQVGPLPGQTTASSPVLSPRVWARELVAGQGCWGERRGRLTEGPVWIRWGDVRWWFTCSGGLGRSQHRLWIGVWSRPRFRQGSGGALGSVPPPHLLAHLLNCLTAVRFLSNKIWEISVFQIFLAARTSFPFSAVCGSNIRGEPFLERDLRWNGLAFRAPGVLQRPGVGASRPHVRDARVGRRVAGPTKREVGRGGALRARGVCGRCAEPVGPPEASCTRGTSCGGFSPSRDGCPWETWRLSPCRRSTAFVGDVPQSCRKLSFFFF